MLRLSYLVPLFQRKTEGLARRVFIIDKKCSRVSWQEGQKQPENSLQNKTENCYAAQKTHINLMSIFVFFFKWTSICLIETAKTDTFD